MLTVATLLLSFTSNVSAQPPTPQNNTILANALRISQVYGAGGNSSATYRNDFVELFNAGSSTINLSSYSIQYASATGTNWSNQKTNLTGSIAPGKYYLIQLASGGSSGSLLPTPDTTGITNMSATAGKIALVNNQTGLPTETCPDPSTNGILDLVGYGASANCYEGSSYAPAPATAVAAIFRAGGGCTDTDQNASDFASSMPSPRNSSSPSNFCDAAPTVSSTTPANGATGVAVDANISVTFSEAVNVSSGWYAISCSSSGTHTAAVSGGPTTFTLDPDGDFAAGENCTVTLYATQVSDVDTNDPPDTMTANVSWNFTIAGGMATCSELFFSEYVEGSSNNKALEIYNGSTGTANLSQYTLEAYFNGNSLAGATLTLSGNLAPGAVYVIANGSAASDILAVANLLNNSVAVFNGDDAIVLKHSGVIVDVIGQIGTDPGTEWGTGLTSTADNTLRRKATISTGDNNGSDTFNPSAEWDGYATDTFDGLGTHTAYCGGDAPPTVASTTPTDGATGVAAGANIVINFSEAVAVAGSWYVINCAASGAHTAVVTGGPTNFTLNPDTDFTTPETCQVTVVAAQVTDQDATDPPDAMSTNYTWSFGVGAAPAPCSTIPQIQGTGNASPCLGHRSAIEGCITGVTATGFYFQDLTGDGDTNTSDGIYAYYYSTWTNPSNLQPGNRVRVSGTVVEYYDTTEFANKSADPLAVTNLGSCTVPTPVIIPPITDPTSDPMTAYEKYEGMRVQMTFSGWVVGATKRFDSRYPVSDPEIAFVDFGSSIPDYSRVFERDYAGYQGINYLSGGLNFDLPNVDFGDDIAGTNITGVLGYQFSKYTLLVDSTFTFATVDNADVPYTAPALDTTKAEVDICYFNVENLFDNLDDGAGDWGDWAPGYPTPGSAAGLATYNAKLAKVATAIATRLQSCMVVGVEEMEGKQQVYNDLAAALHTADASHTWTGIYVESGDSRDISQGFLYRNDVTLLSGPTPVSGSPYTGWVADSTLNFVRVPASAEFRFHAGQPQQLDVILYAVHFKSKGSSASCSTPDCTDKRELEAADMRDILAHHQTAGEFAIAGGDYNDTFGSSPINILDASTSLYSPYYDLGAAERWSYVFNGESEVLDHIYMTKNLLYATSGWNHAFNPVHINADFPSTEHASDHDPLRLRLRLPSDYGSTPGYGQVWHLRLPGNTLQLGTAWTDDALFNSAADENDSGVVFGVFEPGITAPITIKVQGNGTYGRWLQVWFDWDKDGIFETDAADAERVFNGAAIMGDNVIQVQVPSHVISGIPYRVRLYDSASMSGGMGILAEDPGASGGALGGEVEDGTSPIPTAVTLASFTAAPQGDSIRVTWETATELENLGFNLYRGESAAGPWTPLNVELIAPQNPGGTSGAVYEWLDSGVTPGVTVYYRLEDVDIHGASTFHGPVSATAATPSAVVVTRFDANGATPALALLALAAAGFWRLRRR
ncbi:MAG: hypothetical protein BWY63_01588 [Chloroflexi bacterium ADurb.Bin360]|nr:MAG: hypothetical protein BWY63_01588 [Chloroflexi bacterium ADurb.Bin360]